MKIHLSKYPFSLIKGNMMTKLMGDLLVRILPRIICLKLFPGTIVMLTELEQR